MANNTRQIITSWTNMGLSKTELKKVLRKIKILGIYIKGSFSKGLNVEERVVDGETRPASDKDYVIIFADKPFEMTQKLIGEIKDIKSDITFKNVIKFRQELLYKQNYDSVEMLFFPKRSILFEVPEMTELRKNAAKMLTLKFFQSALNNSSNQFEKFSNEGKTMNLLPEKVEKEPKLEDYISIMNPNLGGGMIFPLKEYCDKTGLMLKHLKYSAININGDVLSALVSDINQKIDAVNSEAAELRKKLGEEFQKGTTKLDYAKWTAQADSVDRIGFVYYNWKADEDIITADQIKANLLRLAMSANFQNIDEDAKHLLETENIEKSKWGIIDPSGEGMQIRASAASDEVEQKYPLGILIYKSSAFHANWNDWKRYHEWVNDIWDLKPEWTKSKDESKKQHRNVERHNVNVRAAELAGLDGGKVQAYDTKNLQQGLFIQKVTSECLKNHSNRLQIDRTPCGDRDHFLAIKFQDEFKNFIPKNKAVEMVLSGKTELQELIKKAREEKVFPETISTEDCEKMEDIFNRIFLKYSMGLASTTEDCNSDRVISLCEAAIENCPD